MRVDPNSFEEFFIALNGVDPYPWQKRLAMRVAGGCYGCQWPDLISVPTGCGKTSCLEIAVFALACQAENATEERTAARRIFFVVDRRVVVDQAFNQAIKIADSLKKAESGILKDVSNALLSIGGNQPGALPLECYELRGGTFIDKNWAKKIAQPMIVATTIDQVGSRLLFRGYGVSDYSLPIHAALVANDSLLIIDEAHTATPFVETLGCIKILRHINGDTSKAPFSFVSMTATATHKEKSDLSIVKVEEDDLNNPAIGKIVAREKNSRLKLVKSNRNADYGSLVSEIVKEVKDVCKGPPKVIGVMVNRVQTAVSIFKDISENKGTDAILLTGRMRPVDRDAVLSQWYGLLSSKCSEKRNESLNRSLIVVSTQCLEVGADIDFDSLITECASLDAVLQRFGRLNRKGRNIDARGVILTLDRQVKDGAEPDSIYGESLARTWAFLESISQEEHVDMSYSSILRNLSKLESDTHRNDLFVKREGSPVLLPSHLDALCQTSPKPSAEPEVALFLHGPRAPSADVSVCWRADLQGDWGERVWRNLLSVCPPLDSECLSVPIWALRNMMATPSKAVSFSDMESEDQSASPEGDGIPGKAMIWRGTRDSWFLDGSRIVRPGDVLVIGEDETGWEAIGSIRDSYGKTSSDIYDRARKEAKKKPIIRIHPKLLDEIRKTSIGKTIVDYMEWNRSEEDDSSRYDKLKGLLEALSKLSQSKEASRDDGEGSSIDGTAAIIKSLCELSSELLSELEKTKTAMMSERDFDRRVLIIPYPEWKGLIVKLRKMRDIGHEVTLDDHLRAAETDAQRVVRSIPLGKADAMCKAASLHDVGKADLRFQALLMNSNLQSARASNVLRAKSRTSFDSYDDYENACRKSSCPMGYRHEFLSVRAAEHLLDTAVEDRDLIIHLIGSHHGRCRPFAPFVEDGASIEVYFNFLQKGLCLNSETRLEALDSGVPERFWKLTRTHGWWGLAMFEATLRCSDYSVSASGDGGSQETNDADVDQ